MRGIRHCCAFVTTALILAAAGGGAPQQIGNQQPSVGKAQPSPFLGGSEYPDRIGRAVWDAFAKHQFADSFLPGKWRFATPWIVLRGSDASFWFVAERFQSEHRFDRIHAQVTQDDHVTVSITPYQFGPSAWASLGRAFVDARSEGELIAKEITDKLRDSRAGQR